MLLFVDVIRFATCNCHKRNRLSSANAHFSRFLTELLSFSYDPKIPRLFVRYAPPHISQRRRQCVVFFKDVIILNPMPLKWETTSHVNSTRSFARVFLFLGKWTGILYDALYNNVLFNISQLGKYSVTVTLRVIIFHATISIYVGITYVACNSYIAEWKIITSI